MTNLEAALGYQKLGWNVIPLAKGKKKPVVKWQKYQTERITADEVRQWWRKWPNADIAVISGVVSGIFSVDLDSEDAIETYQALYDPNFRDGLCQKTTQGFHAFYKYPSDYDPPLVVGILPKTDLKGNKGYTLLSPSSHESGKKYKWLNINPLEDGIDDLMDPTDELVVLIKDYLKGKNGSGGTITANEEGWEQVAMMGVEKGARNSTVAKLTGMLIGKFHFNRAEVFEQLSLINERNSEPLVKKELIKTIDSVFKTHENNEKLKKNAEKKVEKEAKKAEKEAKKAEKEAKKAEKKAKNNEKSNRLLKLIKKIVLHKSPDGLNRYELFLKDCSVKVSMTELLRPLLVTAKINDAAERVFPVPKNPKWSEFLDMMVLNAERKAVDIEESELAVIKEIIDSGLSQVHYGTEDEGKKCNTDSSVIQGVALIDNSIAVNLEEMHKRLATEEKINIKRFQLCDYLRKLGFEPGGRKWFTVKTGKIQRRLWLIDKEKW